MGEQHYKRRTYGGYPIMCRPCAQRLAGMARKGGHWHTKKTQGVQEDIQVNGCRLTPAGMGKRCQEWLSCLSDECLTAAAIRNWDGFSATRIDGGK